MFFIKRRQEKKIIYKTVITSYRSQSAKRINVNHECKNAVISLAAIYRFYGIAQASSFYGLP